MAEAVEGFGAFVDLLRQQGEQHYLFACLALADPAVVKGPEAFAFAATMMEERRPAFLGRLLGRKIDKAGVRLLYKLDPAPLAKAAYVDLLSASALRPLGKVLSHAQTLPLGVIRALPDFISGKLPIVILELLAAGKHATLAEGCLVDRL